jgi:hypothetical protein
LVLQKVGDKLLSVPLYNINSMIRMLSSKITKRFVFDKLFPFGSIMGFPIASPVFLAEYLLRLGKTLLYKLLFHSTTLLFTGFTIFFLNYSLFSDTIYLKNGKKYDGIYISEDKDSVVFTIEMQEKKVFSKKDIQNIDLDFSGIPIEYSLKDNPKKVISGVLYSIDDKKAVIVLPDSQQFELTEVELDTIYRLRANKTGKGESISRVLKPNASVKLGVKGTKELQEGRVQTVDGNSLKIDSEKTGTKSISEDEITSLDIDNRPPDPGYKTTWNYLTYLVPGYKQFWRDSTYEKVKGSVMFTGFLALVAVIPYRYMMASQARDNDYDFVPIGGRLYFFQNLTPSNAYQLHAGVYNMAIGSLVALYVYHAVDIYLDIKEQREEDKLVKFTINPFASSLGMSRNPNAHLQPLPNEIEIKFMKQF